MLRRKIRARKLLGIEQQAMRIILCDDFVNELESYHARLLRPKLKREFLAGCYLFTTSNLNFFTATVWSGGWRSG